MRTLNGIGIAVAIVVAGGMSGCQSTSQFADLRSDSDPVPVAKAGHNDEQPGRIVTLEPDLEEAEGGSSWKRLGTKLLNPFAGPKKRMPLPRTLAENEEAGGSPGF